MEKVGQIYQYISNNCYFKITKIENDKLYVSVKAYDEKEWTDGIFNYNIGFFESPHNKLIQDVEEEFKLENHITVSRLSKIE